jgi:hypothetical protein
LAHVKLGRVAGLRITAGPSALIALPVLWAALAGIGWWLLKLSPLEAILGGLIATVLHYLSELVHQLGHARAARLTGHPMIGVRYWLALGASIYPKDEGELPADVHIRRAIGGPIVSLMVALVLGSIAATLRSVGGLVWWVAMFAALDNLIVFTLGALTPLGFTDGSTLLKWWPRRTG